MKKRKIKSKHEILFNSCTNLWTKIIKTRAGFKSEISGKGKESGYNIAAHHVFGKKNYALRFSVMNGICLEAMAEHLYGIHSSDPDVQEIYKDAIKHAKGKEYDSIRLLKHQTWGDLKLIKIYLDDEYKKLKVETNE